MALVEYVIGAELPDLGFAWYDENRNLIDFSSGYTFTVKVWNTVNVASPLTKTTGITGAATSPNVLIAWTITELAALAAGTYTLRVIARRTSDSKDRVMSHRLSLLPAAP